MVKPEEDYDSSEESLLPVKDSPTLLDVLIILGLSILSTGLVVLGIWKGIELFR